MPLDRVHASQATIPVAFYVRSHSDAEHPALEPILTTPGGPGASIWAQRDGPGGRAWRARHDTVLIERRGVGQSGGILCAALQGGVTPAEVLSATSACAAQLGAAADRYGTGDVALDIEAVRQALGISSFDFYAASYATLAAQAYVTRFPHRVHALVLDSGFAEINTPMDLFGTQYVAPTLRVLDLLCSRSSGCAIRYPHPDHMVDSAIAQLQGHPLANPSGSPIGPLDAWGLMGNLEPSPYPLQAKDYLDALAAFLSGSPGALESLVTAAQSGGAQGDDPNVFSTGDSVASYCTDIAAWVPWQPADSLATRQAKFAAAFGSIDPATYAPLHLADAESAAGGVQQCMSWPAPTRIEPLVPAGAVFPSDLPVLVMSGDVDLNAPIEINRFLLQEFPQASFVVVAGVGHVSSGPGWGPCGDDVVTTFFQTLRADPASCATPSG